MVAITDRLVTGANRRVTAGVNSRRSITVHQTGNTSRGADADAHARLQLNGGPKAPSSWHITVDAGAAFRSYRNTDRCWHSGNTQGNNTSIAVEICVNSDGDYVGAVKAGAQVVAQIMREEGIPLSQVLQHNHWTGKNCPAQIRAGQGGIDWRTFLQLVQAAYDGSAAPAITPPAPSPSPGKTDEQLAHEVIDGVHGVGDARRAALGSRYEAVQRIVNQILGSGGRTSAPADGKPLGVLVQEVMEGRHGHGDARKRSLGARYAEVQAEVNRRLGVGKPSGGGPVLRSIAQVAAEVRRGMWGNGAERERRLKAAGYNYSQVQAEVNRQMR